MKVLLTGANGFVGTNLAVALTGAGHQVKPVSRRHGMDFSTLLSPADWRPYLAGIEAVVNCVGIIGESAAQRFATLHTQAPSALFAACAEVGVRRVIQISALGSDAAAFSNYHRSKLAADDCLRALALDWFVLRPSLIYGRGGKSAELFMRLATLPMLAVIGDGQQALQPVHISDVVATVMHSLTAAQSRQTLDIVGPDRITFAEWLQAMRQAQGLPQARLLHVPFWFASAFARVACHFNPLLQLENLRMLQRGCWADGQPLAQFLGRMPLRAEPRLFFSAAGPARSPS